MDKSDFRHRAVESDAEGGEFFGRRPSRPGSSSAGARAEDFPGLAAKTRGAVDDAAGMRRGGVSEGGLGSSPQIPHRRHRVVHSDDPACPEVLPARGEETFRSWPESRRIPRASSLSTFCIRDQPAARSGGETAGRALDFIHRKCRAGGGAGRGPRRSPGYGSVARPGSSRRSSRTLIQAGIDARRCAGAVGPCPDRRRRLEGPRSLDRLRFSTSCSGRPGGAVRQ